MADPKFFRLLMEDEAVIEQAMISYNQYCSELERLCSQVDEDSINLLVNIGNDILDFSGILSRYSGFDVENEFPGMGTKLSRIKHLRNNLEKSVRKTARGIEYELRYAQISTGEFDHFCRQYSQLIELGVQLNLGKNVFKILHFQDIRVIEAKHWRQAYENVIDYLSDKKEISVEHVLMLSGFECASASKNRYSGMGELHTRAVSKVSHEMDRIKKHFTSKARDIESKIYDAHVHKLPDFLSELEDMIRISKILHETTFDLDRVAKKIGMLIENGKTSISIREDLKDKNISKYLGLVAKTNRDLQEIARNTNRDGVLDFESIEYLHQVKSECYEGLREIGVYDSVKIVEEFMEKVRSRDMSIIKNYYGAGKIVGRKYRRTFEGWEKYQTHEKLFI